MVDLHLQGFMIIYPVRSQQIFFLLFKANSRVFVNSARCEDGTHTIHETIVYLPIHEWWDLYGKVVAKYTIVPWMLQG